MICCKKPSVLIPASSERGRRNTGTVCSDTIDVLSPEHAQSNNTCVNDQVAAAKARFIDVTSYRRKRRVQGCFISLSSAALIDAC